MKRFVLAIAWVAAVFSSSCTVFVFNDDDHGSGHDKDSVSITIIDGAKENTGGNSAIVR